MREYKFDEIEIGLEENYQKKVTGEDEDMFRKITGDMNPLHMDDSFAKLRWGGIYRQHVAFGMLTASLYSTLAGMYLPGKYSLIHSIDNISFRKPVYTGDTLTVTGTVRDKMDDLRLIKVDARIRNQDGATVSTASMKVLVEQ